MATFDILKLSRTRHLWWLIYPSKGWIQSFHQNDRKGSNLDYLQSLKKVLGRFNGSNWIYPPPPTSCKMSIGVILSTSLLDLATLFGGVEEGYGLKKGSSYMSIIVWKTGLKIRAGCEEIKDQNGPSVPTNFFNDCRWLRSLSFWFSCDWESSVRGVVTTPSLVGRGLSRFEFHRRKLDTFISLP